jgi:hypothetical protein
VVRNDDIQGVATLIPGQDGTRYPALRELGNGLVALGFFASMGLGARDLALDLPQILVGRHPHDST